jgi:dCMP deaminase
LDAEHRVIGVAYNGLASGKVVDANFWMDRDTRRPYVLHAETNLLALVKRGECVTVACTLLPCSSCAAAIAAHGIKRVVFRHVYQRDTHAFDIFKFYDITCAQLL